MLEGAFEVVHYREKVADERLVGEPHRLGALSRHALLEVLEVRSGTQPPVVILARLVLSGHQRRVARGGRIVCPGLRLAFPRPVRRVSIVLPVHHAHWPE